MKKEYIKLNETDNYLTLGNIFRIIKEESNCKNTFLQSELFCALFDINYIADSTVNNYLTGLRAINSIYKEKLISKLNQFNKNPKVFVPNIIKVISILENRIVSPEYDINSNNKLKTVCNRLYNISKNDIDISVFFIEEIYKYLSKNNLYDFFIKCLSYTVLEKKQPISYTSFILDTIENKIHDTNISPNDILAFINTHLEESMWSSIRKLEALSKNNNALSSMQMAFYEFHGLIAGHPRYVKSYNYYKIAADLNHPAANWAIGYMYYNGYIGSRTNEDLQNAVNYFNKAMSLGSVSAINSMGLVYLDGKIVKKDKNKATKLFNEAVIKGNIFALNNLGKIYEEDNNHIEAFNYYKKAADLGESWAANKVGEYYRIGKYIEKDIKKAYEYYIKSDETAIYSMSYWAKYNLAKYFYENGNEELKIDRNINLAINLLESASRKIIEATEELIYIYYSLYINSKKDKTYLDKVTYYINKIETSPNYNDEVRLRIQNIMKNIYSGNKHIYFDI